MKKLPDVKNFEKDVLIAQEKEMLGVYITEHPLEEYRQRIEKSVTVTSQDLADVLDSETSEGMHSFVTDGMHAVMAGIITGKKTLITKNNNMMAFVDMEDLYGTVEVVVFPNIYEKFGNLVAEDRIVSIAGTINFKEGEMPKLLADRIVDIRELEAVSGGSQARELRQQGRRENTAAAEPEGIVKIKLPEGDTSLMLRRIKDIMTDHRGNYQSIVYMPTGGSFRTERDLWVEPDRHFREAITAIVGEENYKG